MFERRVSATRSLRQVESGRHTKTHERNLLGRNNLSLVQFFSPLRLNIRHTNSLFSALFVLDDRHRVSIGFSRSLSRSTEVCVTTKVTSKANGKRDTHAVRPYESLSLSLSLSHVAGEYIYARVQFTCTIVPNVNCVETRERVRVWCNFDSRCATIDRTNVNLCIRPVTTPRGL